MPAAKETGIVQYIDLQWYILNLRGPIGEALSEVHFSGRWRSAVYVKERCCTKRIRVVARKVDEACTRQGR
jgi:hypothetical protein